MSSIFRNRQNDKLSVNNIVVKKVKKLKEIYDNNIQHYLYNKLSIIYLGGISIFDILYDTSHDNGLPKYDTSGCCFYISAGIIHAMNNKDLLVNGNLAPEHSDGFRHQWVEFCFNDKWYVIDSSLRKVYDRDHYYSVFMPIINFRKSKEELMKDDFVRKHYELLKNPEWSYDDFLLRYYIGYKIEDCKKRLYENIEVDGNGHIISYNNPNMVKSQSK